MTFLCKKKKKKGHILVGIKSIRFLKGCYRANVGMRVPVGMVQEREGLVLPTGLGWS